MCWSMFEEFVWMCCQTIEVPKSINASKVRRRVSMRPLQMEPVKCKGAPRLVYHCIYTRWIPLPASLPRYLLKYLLKYLHVFQALPRLFYLSTNPRPGW